MTYYKAIENFFLLLNLFENTRFNLPLKNLKPLLTLEMQSDSYAIALFFFREFTPQISSVIISKNYKEEKIT